MATVLHNYEGDSRDVCYVCNHLNIENYYRYCTRINYSRYIDSTSTECTDSTNGTLNIFENTESTDSTGRTESTDSTTHTLIRNQQEINLQSMYDTHVHENDMYMFTNNNTIKGTKRRRIEYTDIIPVSTAKIYQIIKSKHILIDKILSVLFDSGSSHSFIKNEYKNYGTIKNINKIENFNTAAGKINPKYKLNLSFIFNQITTTRRISHTFRVMDTTTSDHVSYDMIIGRDLMNDLGIIIDCKHKLIKWDGLAIEMMDKPMSKEMNTILREHEDPEIVQQSTQRLHKILDAVYQKADIEQFIQTQTHLSFEQRMKLKTILLKYESLFDGTLGTWNIPPIDIYLKKDAIPFQSKPYKVPKINEETFKKEIQRMVQIGVLERDTTSNYSSPSFIIPKKNGTVRFVSDFRKLNKIIIRRQYPIPNITDTLNKLEGFQFATSLDLNMGYWHITLSPEASNLCTIVTPWGKYKYKRLPMGIACAPDIFQEKIHQLMGDLQYIRAYLDDILCITNRTFEDHLEKLENTFRRLQLAGLKVNLPKCQFALPEIEYLGYVISRQGIKPCTKKIDAIMKLKRPTTRKELRRFLGMVQYYRDLWPRRSHILTPLTNSSNGKAKLEWTQECEQAFQTIKKIIAREVLMAYPNFNQPFDIYTDASDYQLGSVIMQGNKPIAFYSRKLNKAQRNYNTTHKELLSIVETLKEFRNILLGMEVNIYTDHKNLTYETAISENQRLQRWRLIIEEFAPNIQHIEGKANIVADAISRLPTNNDPESDSLDHDENTNQEIYTMDPVEEDEFPLDYKDIKTAQELELHNNIELQTAVANDSSDYKYQEFENYNLITYKNKMFIPTTLRARTLNWYHQYLCHPGGDRLANTIKQVCHWPGITNQSRLYCKKCKICQKYKKRKIKYGQLPPKEVPLLQPWETLCVDLIGPLSQNVKQLQPDGSIKKVMLKLLAMTFIDPATGWFEITEIDQQNQTSAKIATLLDETWLCRYPRPKEIIFDNGSQFKKDFQPLLKDFRIKPSCTTIKNPQANAILERIHQVVKNMIRTQQLKSRIFDYNNPWSHILASIAWAIRASYHTVLQATPAQLVYNRDMIFNITHLANWHDITNQKRKQVLKDNERENYKRIKYDYQVDDMVYIIKDGNYRALDSPHLGPYKIIQVYTNGTVRIQKSSKYTERINIRRLTPQFI